MEAACLFERFSRCPEKTSTVQTAQLSGPTSSGPFFAWPCASAHKIQCEPPVPSIHRVGRKPCTTCYNTFQKLSKIRLKAHFRKTSSIPAAPDLWCPTPRWSLARLPASSGASIWRRKIPRWILDHKRGRGVEVCKREVCRCWINPRYSKSPFIKTYRRTKVLCGSCD